VRTKVWLHGYVYNQIRCSVPIWSLSFIYCGGPIVAFRHVLEDIYSIASLMLGADRKHVIISAGILVIAVAVIAGVILYIHLRNHSGKRI
jgi:hypothetical protein